MDEIDTSQFELPKFVLGAIFYNSSGQNYRVVMGYKPGMEGDPKGRRFFVEPRTDEAQGMLRLAAREHHINNFNRRPVPNLDDNMVERDCLRADFILENVPVLVEGYVDIPKPGDDSIPSPNRMEQCLLAHQGEYTFQD